jgi:hypothetical protein
MVNQIKQFSKEVSIDNEKIISLKGNANQNNVDSSCENGSKHTDWVSSQPCLRQHCLQQRRSGTKLNANNQSLDKENVVHIYNGVLVRHKENRIMSFAGKWIELEDVMLSKISQVQKYKYCMLLLLCGIYTEKKYNMT